LMNMLSTKVVASGAKQARSAVPSGLGLLVVIAIPLKRWCFGSSARPLQPSAACGWACAFTCSIWPRRTVMALTRVVRLETGSIFALALCARPHTSGRPIPAACGMVEFAGGQ
jgi:hypothetical protein